MKNGIKFDWREFAKALCGCAFFMLICFETWWIALIGVALLGVAKLI